MTEMAQTKKMTKQQIAAITDAPTGTLVIEWTENFGNVDTKKLCVIDMLSPSTQPGYSASVMAYNLLVSLAAKNRDLITRSKSIERTMKKVRERIAAGQWVNSLGELQSAGPSFDVLCSERQQILEHLEVLIGTVAIEQAAMKDRILAKLAESEVAS
jgi:hypothetical protein